MLPVTSDVFMTFHALLLQQEHITIASEQETRAEVTMIGNLTTAR